jgi:hypothetical protein
LSPKATDIIAQGAMTEANETLRSIPSATRSLKASNLQRSEKLFENSRSCLKNKTLRTLRRALRPLRLIFLDHF